MKDLDEHGDLGKSDRETKKTSILDDLDEIGDKDALWKAPSTKRIVTGGTLMTTMDIVCGGLLFTLYMMTVSRASTQEASLLAIVDTFAGMLRIFATLGFVGAGAKFLSEYLARDKKEAEHYLISASKYNFLFTGLPIIGISIVLYLIMPENSTERTAYAILIIMTIFDRLASCPNIILMGYQRYDYYTWSFFIPLGAQYVFAAIFFPIYGILGALIPFMLARVAMFVLAMIFASRVSEFPVSDLFKWHKEFGLLRKMISFNLLYSLANLAFSLLTTTLLITLGEAWKMLTPQEVQALYVLTTFSNILINVFGIVAPIQQAISEAHALRNNKLVANYTLTCVKFPIIMSVAVITFFLAFGPEMIAILYGSRWVVIGLVILAILPLAYAFGSFASRYDNILAGVGRPETAIIPWFLALGVAIIGIWCARFVPATYIVDSFWTDKETGEVLNLGYTVRFIYLLLVMNGSLLIAGVWIVWVAFRVLDVKVPWGYLYKPILAAGCAAAIIVPIRLFLGVYIKAAITDIGYLVVMVLIGVTLLLVFGVLFDMMNVEDGRFWKSVIGHMGPVSWLMRPIFRAAGKLLKYQVRALKADPIEWVLKTNRETLEKDMLFSIESQVDGKRDPSVREYLLDSTNPIRIRAKLIGLTEEFYDFLAYLKVDFRKVPATAIYKEEISGNLDLEFELTLDDLPKKVTPGLHELYVRVEMYNRKRPGTSKEELLKGGLWRYFDYRLWWYFEDQFYIRI